MDKQEKNTPPSSMEEELTPPDRISVATTATSTDRSLPGAAVATNRQPNEQKKRKTQAIHVRIAFSKKVKRETINQSYLLDRWLCCLRMLFRD